MGLASFTFVQWAPKEASILQQSAGRKRIWFSVQCYAVHWTDNNVGVWILNFARYIIMAVKMWIL